MNGSTLIARSLWHFRRTNLGVLLGTAIGAGVLTGALMVGDTVRHSLVERVHERLGDVAVAVSSGEHLVTPGLAGRLGKALESRTAAVLALRGSASVPDGSARANRVSVVGVDSAFRRLAPDPNAVLLPGPGEVCLNARLAEHLGVTKGDTIVLRAEKPGTRNREMQLVDSGEMVQGMRLRVRAVAGPNAFGRFSLRAEQALPMNAFVAREVLSSELDTGAAANLLLLDARESDRVAEALETTWTAEDTGLSAREVRDGTIEIRSRGVFMSPRLLAAIRGALPRSREVFSYFVNELRSGDRMTPYSFVSAPGAAPVPDGMPDDGVVINRWLADDLGVADGATLEMRYFVQGPDRALIEEGRRFRVHKIVDLSGSALDPDLMPAFPGLSEAANCRDWDPEIPLNLDKVRDKDEAYWDTYGGTPKAFVTLKAAQAMWSNRYGRATAVRVPAAGRTAGTCLDAVVRALHPGDVGLRVLPVRQTGLRASREGVDFGSLFLGLSMFLIVAAMLLTGLLFAFGEVQRTEETGILLALGFTRKQVDRLRIWEAFWLALPGVIAGMGLAVACNRAVAWALGGAWQDVVGTVALEPVARPATMGIGAVISMVVAWGAMWLAARRNRIRTPAELQRGPDVAGGVVRRARRPFVFGMACWLSALVVAGTVGSGSSQEQTGIFFGIGTLTLFGSLAFIAALLAWLGKRLSSGRAGLTEEGIRGCARRPGRSLATAGFLAIGVFLVIATGANRPDPVPDPRARDSGTGGFELFARTAVPLLDPAPPSLPHGVDWIAMRLFEGDDASCLNLNRVTQPPVLGVNPSEPAVRQAFAFARVMKDAAPENPWLLLNQPLSGNGIPAIADQEVITWGLGKAVGETLDIVDAQGEPLRLKLVAGLKNSILQGFILIAEERFLDRFPGIPGRRVFLIDVESDDVGTAAGALSRAYRDLGMDVSESVDRLAAFAAVQNTYLAIFLFLGFLGLLLGSMGMGILVARNVAERRGELAMMLALGFRRRALMWMLVAEHGALFAAGLVAGAVSGLSAVLPALRSQGAEVSAGLLGLLVAALFVNGLVWVLASLHATLRGPLLPALREE